jgi:hypothetical protein
MTDANGFQIGPNFDPPLQPLTRLQAFLMSMPPAQLDKELELMDANLKRLGKPGTSKRELLRFYGVIILISRLRPHDCRELWNGKSHSKYIIGQDLSRTGITRHWFDDMLTCWEVGECPKERPTDMEYSTWAWMKIDCYVTNFNEHRATYTPSDRVCVDESISKWNGLGGFWINKGLLHFVAMARKPKDGCEDQTCCDARSGIMMPLDTMKQMYQKLVLESSSTNGS